MTRQQIEAEIADLQGGLNLIRAKLYLHSQEMESLRRQEAANLGAIERLSGLLTAPDAAERGSAESADA